MRFITSEAIPATISPFYICLSFFITIFASYKFQGRILNFK